MNRGIEDFSILNLWYILSLFILLSIPIFCKDWINLTWSSSSNCCVFRYTSEARHLLPSSIYHTAKVIGSNLKSRGIIFFEFSLLMRLFKAAYAITDMAPRYVKVPNSAVAVDAWAELACYPRSSFCPLSFDLILVRVIGSLSSAFAPARHVRLAVKLACPFTGPARFPSALSQP